MPYGRRRTPIGRRRERIELQQRTTASDGIGGQTVTWATVARPWAAVVPLDRNDQESIRGDQQTVEHSYHFDLRYRWQTRPKPTDRVLWRDRTLEIRTVVDDTADTRRIVLQCGEIQDSYAAS